MAVFLHPDVLTLHLTNGSGLFRILGAPLWGFVGEKIDGEHKKMKEICEKEVGRSESKSKPGSGKKSEKYRTTASGWLPGDNCQL